MTNGVPPVSAEGALNTGQRILLGRLRLVKVDADPVAVVVAGGQLDAAVLHAAAQFIVYGHALQLAAEQLACLGRGGAGRRGVGLGAHAEHLAVVAVRQVAVGEARAREDVPHELFVVGWPAQTARQAVTTAAAYSGVRRRPSIFTLATPASISSRRCGM